MALIPTWLATAVGLAVTAAFALLCLRDMRRAILVFVAIGWVPFLRVFTFSGTQTTQPLLLAEAFPTVMIAVWWLRRVREPAVRVVPASVNRPLLLMIPISLVSLLWSVGDLDPAVPAVNVKLAVSLGQVLLIAWPVGLYFVVANTIADAAAIQAIRRILTVLAVPSLALTVVPPAWRTYVVWSVYFALAAGPWFVARSFSTRAPLGKLALWALALSPFAYGLVIGKAFLYVTTAVALGTVVFLRARRSVVAGLLCATGL